MKRSTTTRLAGDLTVVQVWLVTRLLFAVIAVWQAVRTGRNLRNVLAQWDVEHFLTIAANGYADPKEMAFFPGLPLILRGLGEAGLDPVIAGSLLALACSLVAAFAVKRLAGTWGAVAWLLAPTAVFTAVPYTESFFCAAAFWAWERATQRRWAQAAALAAVACTFRVSGLFLIGALAILALELKRRRGESVAGRLGWLLLPALVIAAYVVHLHALTGSWTAWFSAQEAGWQRGFHWPWEALRNHWDVLWKPTPEHPEWVWVFRAEMISWVVGLVTAVVCLLRRRIAESAWVAVQVLAFSLSYWLMSVTRAVLLWFPLWRLVDDLVESRRRSPAWRAAGWVVALVAVAFQCVWAWLYFTGRWSS